MQAFLADERQIEQGKHLDKHHAFSDWRGALSVYTDTTAEDRHREFRAMKVVKSFLQSGCRRTLGSE